MRLTVTNKTNGLVMLPNPIGKGIRPNSTKVFDNVDPIDMAKQSEVWSSMEDSGVIAFTSNDDPEVPDQIEAVTEESLISHYKLNVDHVSGDDSIATGSLSNPFRTIQAALDYAADMTLIGSYTTVEINIPEIKSTEALVYNGLNRIILRGEGIVSFIAPPAGQVPLTITNATKDSLATYRASGLYSDLVNQGDAGPSLVSIHSVYFSGSGGANAIEVLGVAGDAGPGLTNFGYFRMESSYINGTVYCRNTRSISAITMKNWGRYTFHNCSYMTFMHTMARHYIVSYDAADPEGQPASGSNFLQGYDVHQWGDLTATGDCAVWFWSGHTDGNISISDTSSALFNGYGCSGNLDINGTATVEHTEGYVGGNVNAEAGSSWRSNGVHVQGALSFDAGVGTARMDGGRYMGALTDPGGKFVRNAGN